MNEYPGNCHARIPPAGETGSWVRDHVCRLEPNHPGPHHCTCQWEWEHLEPVPVSA